MTPSRRQFLAASALSAGALAAGVHAQAPAGATRPASGRSRACRIAHLTDTHIQPERGAGPGVAACLRHLRDLPDRPELIVTGGDSIMDAMDAGEARARTQWDLWHKTLADEAPVPVRSCIGNHDVWGWNRTRSKTTGQEDRWGKKWALEALRLENRYTRFALPKAPGAAAGWTCIILDSIHPEGEGYKGRLDGEQLEWLKGELAAHDKESPNGHILIVSHIPILSACVFFDRPDGKRRVDISPSLMHEDAEVLKGLFAQHRSVKACAAGHLHQVERIEFNNVTYLCNGAVSGAWWGGRHIDCDEGYALLDLYDDGTIDRTYVTYGWKAEKA